MRKGRLRLSVGGAILLSSLALCSLSVWRSVSSLPNVVAAHIRSAHSNQGRPIELPENFLLSPKFVTTQGEVEAGTAFVTNVRANERQVILTALHLLGPDGGLKSQIAPIKAAM